jgi:hypothetical protein
VIAYEDDEKLKQVAKELGDQLLKVKKDINSAITCYILSNELEIVTDLWKKRALYQMRKQGADKFESLFHLFQKTILMRHAIKQSTSSDDIDLMLADFGEFLSSEQMNFLAMKYLQMTSNSNERVQNLKNRLFFGDASLQ